MKRCTKCGETKALSEFHNHKNRPDGKTAWCKSCAVARQSEIRLRRDADPAARAEYLKKRRYESKIDYWENRESESTRKRAQNRKVKDEVLQHYGGKCACCGETEPLFLAIDHIHGGGNAHRRTLGSHRTGHNFYRWLKVSGYPAGFQILCHNCNWGKYANNGVCPHNTGEDK